MFDVDVTRFWYKLPIFDGVFSVEDSHQNLEKECLYDVPSQGI